MTEENKMAQKTTGDVRKIATAIHGSFEKMAEKRAKEKVQERNFAAPKNTDEATGKMPTLEQLANGNLKLHPSLRWKSKEEILESGTIIEKLRLFFSALDLNGYFGTNRELTKLEQEEILKSIRTEKDVATMRRCCMEYNTLIEYGKELRFYFKRFQTSFAVLATLLNKWDSYENTAKQLSIMYGMMESARFCINPHGTEDGECEKWVQMYTDENLKDWVSKYKKKLFEKANLEFDDVTKHFWVDVKSSQKMGLYREIVKEAKTTREALSDFKAFAVAIEEFIRKSTLKYTPISIKMSIENAEEENYTRYLVKNLSFFRSELNLRKKKGKSITPEEEKRAVIQDYYEVTPTKEVYDSCASYIIQLIKNYTWVK